MFGEFAEAAKNAEMAEKHLLGVIGTILVCVFHFYDYLIQLSLYPNASNDLQKSILEKVAVNQEKSRFRQNLLQRIFSTNSNRQKLRIYTCRLDWQGNKKLSNYPRMPKTFR